MNYKYIARPCKNCEDNECCFKGHENNFEVCEDYTATNGEVIKALFPNISIYEHGSTYSVNNEYNFNSTWWNAPYEKEVEE